MIQTGSLLLVQHRTNYGFVAVDGLMIANGKILYSVKAPEGLTLQDITSFVKLAVADIKSACPYAA